MSRRSRLKSHLRLATWYVSTRLLLRRAPPAVLRPPQAARGQTRPVRRRRPQHTTSRLGRGGTSTFVRGTLRRRRLQAGQGIGSWAGRAAEQKERRSQERETRSEKDEVKSGLKQGFGCTAERGLSATFLLIGRQYLFCSEMFGIERAGGRRAAAGSPHGSSRHAYRRYAEHTFVHQAKPMRCPLTKQAKRC